VDYEPADAVGADRIANVMAALRTFRPPLIIVDFGTATTFDAVDSFGRYLGGAILPGVGVSSEALFARAARLPHVDQLSLTPPEAAIGRTTVGALRSGIVFGYAGAVDALVGRIGRELGGTPKVIATGGLGSMFLGVCESLSEYVPNLTLDGLRLAWDKLAGSSD
jgi:type III pantothenate kinase